MTSRLSLLLFMSLLTIGFTSSPAPAQGQPPKNSTKPIPMAQLNSSKVIGALGRPLGAVVTIDGIATDENYTRRKADAGEILLRVQAVNGKALKREAIISCHPYEGAEMNKPSAGRKFKYVGYETGGFSGMPESAFVYVPRTSTSGYYFTTSFVILRDDSAGKLP